jgi:hypothetical protein
MPIPNADSAYVPAEKLTDYLLNENHPVGGSKAKWFRALGYDTANKMLLEQALLNLVRSSEDYAQKSSALVTKYIVSGKISAPNAADVNVITVWIIEALDNRPRLVTAYPGARQ